MCIAFTSRSIKDRILELFTKPDGEIRFLVATIALGMGVNTPNILCSIHWGCSDSTNAYVHARVRRCMWTRWGTILCPSILLKQATIMKESRYVLISYQKRWGFTLLTCQLVDENFWWVHLKTIPISTSLNLSIDAVMYGLIYACVPIVLKLK